MKRILLVLTIMSAIMLSSCQKKSELVTEAAPEETAEVTTEAVTKSTEAETEKEVVVEQDTEETEAEETEETAEEETTAVAVPDESYRYLCTVNRSGRWDATNQFDIFVSVTEEDGRPASYSSYARSSEETKLLDTVEIGARADLHELEVLKALSGQKSVNLNISSYIAGDSYIDIINGKGILILEVNNSGYAFYVLDEYDGTLVDNYVLTATE